MEDRVQALVIEPLRNFAALLADGEISGEAAGELLGLRWTASRPGWSRTHSQSRFFGFPVISAG